MDTTVIDIELAFLALSFALYLISIVISLVLKLGIIRDLLFAVARMTGQLTLVGIFLKYLFTYDNTWVNLLWLLVMIVFAVFSAVKNAGLKSWHVLPPALFSFIISTLSILLFVNIFVLRLENAFSARYLIVLGGMLLGNALRGSVIGIRTFFDSIKKDTGRYRYRLALGATRIQALIPYIRECMNAALRPTIATMSTMGIVFLPGMMTGQILGGATPITAIKYQLLIMAAIFTCVNLSVLFTVIFTLPFGFTPYGTLRRDIFR